MVGIVKNLKGLGVSCDTLPPVAYECPPPLPCEPSPKCCPATLSVRKYITIGVTETERCLLVRQGSCTKPNVQGCIEFRVRRRGCCDVLSVEKPYRLSMKGALCFKWSEQFLKLQPGYYEADVYRKGKPCDKVGFVIQSCRTNVTTDEVIDQEPCKDNTPCCDLEVNQDPYTPPPIETNCETC